MSCLKNTTILTKNDFFETNFHTYFKSPRYVILNIVCLISISFGLVDFFVYGSGNLGAVILFAIALVFLVIVFFTSTNALYKQNFIDDKPLQFDFTVDCDGISVAVSSGASTHISYNMIRSSFETKNNFVLKTTDNSLFIIKKDGFTAGSADDFSLVLKNIKNGVMPVFADNTQSMEK